MKTPKVLLLLALIGGATGSCEFLPLTAPSAHTPVASAPTLELSNVLQITDDQFLYRNPEWSPDGASIAVARNRSNQTPAGPSPFRWEIVLIDPQTLESKSLSVGEDYSLTYPTWSPGGDQLAFIAYDGELNHLITYSIASGEWKDLGCQFCDFSTWRALGNEIFAGALLGAGPGQSGEFGIVTVNPSSGDWLTERRIGEPYWGPFTVSPGGETAILPDRDCIGIWQYSFPSRELTALVDAANQEECDPQLSFDGTKLAYTTKDLPSIAPTSLVVSDADGSSPFTLLNPTLAVYQIHDLTWSPDGSKIAFAYGLFSLTSPAVSTLYTVDVPPELRPSALDS